MRDSKDVIDAALVHELVREVIEEQTGNLTQRHFEVCDLNRAVSDVLSRFARRAAEMSLKGPMTSPNLSDPNWQQDFANAAVKTMRDHDVEVLVNEIKREIRVGFPDTVGDRADIRYSYLKIASYVGQVSRMIWHGLDPSLLSMSEEEAAKHQLKLLDMARKAGVPTVVVVPKGDDGGRGRYKK